MELLIFKLAEWIKKAKAIKFSFHFAKTGRMKVKSSVDLYCESKFAPDNVAPELKTGFNFDNCARNLTLDEMGVKPPKAVSTGTTIVACCYADGVVMGADSRATAGGVVADKFCEKVHHLTDSIYACGAGTAADLHQVCRMLESYLGLLELNTARRAPVIAALRKAKQHLFRYQGYIGAYLLIGGVDATGPHLFECHAHGSTSKLPFAADGSGSYAAISVLERGFKFGMTEAEARQLVQQGLEAGMHGDNMSGNSLRLVVIRKDGAEFLDRIIPAFCVRPEPNDLDYTFKKGATKVMKAKEIKFEVVEQMEVDDSSTISDDK